jgi:undecaprenyl-diphosphatase
VPTAACPYAPGSVPTLHAIVLGIVQGLSEFIPISSSGHLRLVPWLMNWNDFEGRESFERVFDVALHLGTLGGAVAYFRKDLWRLAKGALAVVRRRAEGDEAQNGRLAWFLLASTIPAALIGAALSDPLDDVAQHEWLIGVLLVVFGLVLLGADRIGGHRGPGELRLRDALILGTAQAAALVPGVSRSGATITAARFQAFDRDSAARISFLMSLPIIAGALVWEGRHLVADGMPPGFGAAFAWGIVSSAVTGYLAVWGTLRLVRTRSFAPFVVYRVLAGVAVVAIAASSFR